MKKFKQLVTSLTGVGSALTTYTTTNNLVNDLTPYAFELSNRLAAEQGLWYNTLNGLLDYFRHDKSQPINDELVNNIANRYSSIIRASPIAVALIINGLSDYLIPLLARKNRKYCVVASLGFKVGLALSSQYFFNSGLLTLGCSVGVGGLSYLLSKKINNE